MLVHPWQPRCLFLPVKGVRERVRYIELFRRTWVQVGCTFGLYLRAEAYDGECPEDPRRIVGEWDGGPLAWVHLQDDELAAVSPTTQWLLDDWLDLVLLNRLTVERACSWPWPEA